MDIELLKRIVEGALMCAGKPLSLQQLAELFPEDERPSSDELREALTLIEAASEGRGFELQQVASGYRFQVIQEVAPWVGRMWEEKPQRYSRAMLETLALIAYRQPITRGDIEDIRGVAVSSQIIKTLLEREWVRVVGHKDVPGRPAMYATTRKFLDYFNLRNLDELPTLADIKDLDSLNGEFEFSEAVLAEEGEHGPEASDPDSAAADAAAEADTAPGDDGLDDYREDDERAVGAGSELALEAEVDLDDDIAVERGDDFAEEAEIDSSSVEAGEQRQQRDGSEPSDTDDSLETEPDTSVNR